MNDNTTPHSAQEYDQKINATIPFYGDFYEQTLDMASQYGFGNGKWLDLGCGTGSFEQRIVEAFPDAILTALDPSESMLEQAKSKTANYNINYIQAVTTDIVYSEEFDIVTAIQSHHYMKEREREQATLKVWRALKKHGVYISFENICSDDEAIKARELLRWGRYQVRQGKTEEEALTHNKRCGVNYFPITVEQHVALLKETGFSHVYVFWRSYMQMGIMGIK